MAFYHFMFLLPNYSTLVSNGGQTASTASTAQYSSTYIASNGYSQFFAGTILDFAIFKITVWTVVLFLFLVVLLSFLSKLILGSISLYFFFKAKNVRCIYASFAVIFLPMIGAIIALNTYRAHVSNLTPKYIAPYSALRSKVSSKVMSFISNQVSTSIEEK